MKGRLRMTLSRPKSTKQQAYITVVDLLTHDAVRAKASLHQDGSLSRLDRLPKNRVIAEPAVIGLAAAMYNDALARIAYAIENPDASLRWINGEGFRLFGDNGDEEVLFKLGREDRA